MTTLTFRKNNTNPFDSKLLEISGGNMHSQTHLARFVHWSAKSRQERDHMLILRRNGVKDLSEKIHIIDYEENAALMALDNIADDKILKKYSKDAQVLLPFNFSRRPDLAFETILMRYAPVSLQKKVGRKKKGLLIDVCKYLQGKKGFTSRQILPIMESGIGKKIVMSKSKSMSKLSKAIIMAWEYHFMVENDRKFSGASIEYEGTEYEMNSFAYDFEGKSARIMFGPLFRLPIVKYNVPNPDIKFSSGYNSYDVLFSDNPDPRKRVNISKDKKKWKTIVGIEEDWMNNNKDVQVTLWQPTDAIINHASNILIDQYGLSMSPSEIRHMYINDYKKNRE